MEISSEWLFIPNYAKLLKYYLQLALQNFQDEIFVCAQLKKLDTFYKKIKGRKMTEEKDKKEYTANLSNSFEKTDENHR